MKVLSLFDGISSGRVALERAGIPVDVYYASEIDKYAIQIAQKNYPDTIQIGDVCKIDFTKYAGEIDLLIGGSPCFPAGTLVFTDNGFIPIEDIKVGDKVLTHTGKFQKVLRTGSKLTKELRLLSGGGIGRLFCTPNHPFYVRDVLWKGPIAKRTLGVPYWLEAEKISKDKMISTTPPNFELDPYKDEAFWKFIGRYVGDGWFRKTKRKGRKNSFIYQVIICCTHDEFDELKELFDSMNCNYNFSKERTVYKFRICQKWLVDFVEQNIGKGASNKQIPNLLFKQPDSYKKAFLQGLIDSDGCSDNNRIRVATTSKKLAYGVKLLVMELYNVLPQVHYNNVKPYTVIENRTVNQKPFYDICWYPQQRKQQNYIYDLDKFWSYLRHNDIIHQEEIVYNLEIENDNSYTADTIIVHNCQGFSFAGKQLNFNDPRSKLFFEFVRAVREIKPKYFLLENVKMKQEYQDIISEQLGVQPIEINSALVSAQNRKRLYWTNIPGVCPPEDKSILLKDIIHEYTELDGDAIAVSFNRKDGICGIKDKASALCSSDYRGLNRNQTQNAVVGGNIWEIPEWLKKYIMPFDKSLQILNKAAEKDKIGYFRKDSQANRIYSLHGILAESYIRKLTPIECERLQTLTEVKKQHIIDICSDHQKNYASAASLNPKSQNAVGNAGNDKTIESALFAERDLTANNPVSTNVVRPNVRVYIAENRLVILYQGNVLLDVSFVELKKQFPHRKRIDDFARLFVLISLIQGKITLAGEEELPQNGLNLTVAKNGNSAVKLSGKEIMQSVNYAEKDLTIVPKLLNATTLSHLDLVNLEQTLKTLYCYVASVIVSYIPKEIQTNCTLEIQTELGYTFGVSDSQRYIALGNGWTVDVIAQIFKGLKG